MNIDLEVTDVSIDTEVDVADIEILASFDNPTSLSDLSSDSMHRVVTDEMISEWNSKQDELNYTPENISNKRVWIYRRYRPAKLGKTTIRASYNYIERKRIESA